MRLNSRHSLPVAGCSPVSPNPPLAADSESIRFAAWYSSSAGTLRVYCLMRNIPVTTALSFFPAELA